LFDPLINMYSTLWSVLKVSEVTVCPLGHLTLP
jgi:hypothetical protein